MRAQGGEDRAVWWIHHAPRCLAEVALASDIRRLVSGMLDGAPIPNILLPGPPGIGKSTVCRLIVSHLSCDYRVFYASVERGIESIRGDVARFVGALPWAGRTFRIAVIEEADGLTGEAQRALRNVLDTAPAYARFLLCTNSVEAIHEAVRSRCLILDLSATPGTERVRVMRRILEAEGVLEVPSGLERLAATETDMRRLITHVQHSVETGLPLPLPRATATARPDEIGPVSATNDTVTRRKLRRPQREEAIVQELQTREATVNALRDRLGRRRIEVPLPTLHDDLTRLERGGRVGRQGYPGRWYAQE